MNETKKLEKYLNKLEAFFIVTAITFLLSLLFLIGVGIYVSVLVADPIDIMIIISGTLLFMLLDCKFYKWAIDGMLYEIDDIRRKLGLETYCDDDYDE